MTREQACIKELYELVDKITENARKRDLSLIRPYSGASGCDMYQGLPPICRIRDSILDKYEDIIYKAFREYELGMIGECEGTPIEVFKPAPDEVIVYKFKTEPFNLDDIIQVFDNIRDSFPNNTVISIPDNSCLEVFTKDTLIECLQNIIKQLED